MSIRIRKQRGEEDMMILNVVKKRVLTFMFIIILVGLLIPFAAQWIPDEILPWEIHAEIWNSYVSIILGVVATFCSLLSIYLAFYAQNQTIISNNNTIDDFNDIRQEINKSVLRMVSIEEKMANIQYDIRKMDKQTTSSVKPDVSGMETKETEKDLFKNEQTENRTT